MPAASGGFSSRWPIPHEVAQACELLNCPFDHGACEVALPECAEETTGALILGGSHGSLAAARSLGRQGIPVWHLGDGNRLIRSSRYVRASMTWPGTADPAAAISVLIDLAVRRGLRDWVLIPNGDAEVRFVAENHAELAAYFRLPACGLNFRPD